jgi:molybdenum cofactor synthesis domain-containing protein
VAEARHLVLAAMAPLAARRVAISDAVGHVLAQQVLAREAVPRFANSAMDGYAVRAADVASAPVCLRVTGSVAAGDEPAVALGRGEAIRIMTGAPLPSGADAVCMIERARVEDHGSAVIIETAVGPGTNVRQPGEDIVPGAEVIASGTSLGPAHIGVLASLGVQSVLVRPRPVVGVLSTGNELAGPGAVLVPGKIRDANRPALLAQLRTDGFPTVDLGAGPDDQDALLDLLTAGASACDAIVATGGVSVGDHDVLKVAMEKLGGTTMRSLLVAVKPGKHVAFALLGEDHGEERGEQRVPAFGLPGNPVAALVTYELYVRPALRALAGCQVLDRPLITAIAETDLPRRPGPQLNLVRVTARSAPGGVPRVRLSGGQDSHMLRAMAQANGLALLPGGDGVRAGGRVRVLVLDAEWLGTGLGADSALEMVQPFPRDCREAGVERVPGLGLD